MPAWYYEQCAAVRQTLKNPMTQALDDVWLRDTDFVAGDHISIAGEQRRYC